MDSEPPVIKDNAESVRLTREFLEVLNDLAGTHAAALFGIMNLAEFGEELAREKPDGALHWGQGDPNTNAGFAYQRWDHSTLPERFAPEGEVVRTLGQQWIVMVAAQWNDHYRGRIAKALGIDRNDVGDAVMGDLTKMRNDVVHHRGIASARNTGRCEALTWFREGEPIHVMPAHITVVMEYVGNVQATKEIGDGGAWTEEPADV